MSTIVAHEFGKPCFVSQNTAKGSESFPWSLALTAIVISLVFFVAGHDVFTSQAVAYTQTADEMQTAALGGNLVRRVAFFALAGWGLALLALSKQRLKIAWPLASTLAALATLATASLLWTEEPAMCIRRLLALFCCGIGAAGVARAFSLREIAWLVVTVVGSLAMIGVAAEMALGTFTPWAADYRFAGTVHPNTQGPALAVLCLAIVALTKKDGRYRTLLWSIFAVSAVLLLLTKSRTAVAALVVTMAAVQVVKLPPRLQAIGGLCAVWLLAAAMCFLWSCGFDPATDFRDLILLGRSHESESLSGRTLIWPEVMHYGQKRFWLGYGYEAFWTPHRIEDISENLGWGLREAHNGYLELWLWLGVIGVVLLLLLVAAAVFASLSRFRLTQDRSYLLPLGLVVFSLFDSFLESGVVVISLVPFLLGCCLLRLALFPAATTLGFGVVGQAASLPTATSRLLVATTASKFAPG